MWGRQGLPAGGHRTAGRIESNSAAGLMGFIDRELGNSVYISRLIYSGSTPDLLTLFIVHIGPELHLT